jgi:hypothetical protein
MVEWHPLQALAGILVIMSTCWFLMGVNRNKTIPTLFISVALSTLLLVIFIFPSVEAISQRANIEFFKSHSQEDCYLETLGYKSYAPYFYGKVKPPDPEQRNLLEQVRNRGSQKADTLSTSEKDVNYKNWLITGPINKPVYFSVKIMDKSRYDTTPGFQLLYVKNGFAFYRRAAVISVQ